MIDNGHFQFIMDMLKTEKEEEILLNLIQLITSLAEDNSTGRKQAHNARPHLSLFADDDENPLRMYAKDAVQVITWKP